MSLTLELPAELAAALEAEASRLGLSLGDYAVRLLTTASPRLSDIGTGEDLVAYWQREGLIGTRPDIADSSAHARALRDRAQHRDRGMIGVRVLDTDVLIDIQRGHPAASAWFAGLTELPMVPGYVVMELIQDARNARQVKDALRLVAPLPIVWPGVADSQRALKDFSTYHLSHGLGLIYALIGACAIGLMATLCTFNVKHYRAIPGLTLEQPYQR